jgi:hypothetical protein
VKRFREEWWQEISEIFELHIDGTIATQEELVERWSELLDRPVYIERNAGDSSNNWNESYTAFYIKTVGKKKPKQKAVGFIRFQDPEVTRESRLQEKWKQENKEQRAQRKLDRARDASYCLTCRQPVRSKK